MSALTLRDVRKSFGRQAVLRGVDLAIEPGSFTALLGTSGSGKTTLLRLIAGFERVDGGEILIGDEVVESATVHRAPERRHLGVVPQDGALFPHLTVKANLQFGLSRQQRRTADLQSLLALVGLDGLAGRYPHELSGGEQQRAALARALAIEPRLVILDEPFSSLDASLRQSLRGDIRDILRASGATALLVTHDQDEALSLADTVAVLRDGRILQHAAPAAIYETPFDEALARFVGEANVVDGVRVGDQADTALGAVALRPGAASSTIDAVRVLLRPEQVRITDPAEVGMDAEVLATTYFGHSSITRLRPLAPCGADNLIARVEGGAVHAPGSTVTVRATGPAMAWPSVRTSSGSPVVPDDA